eukprot:2307089-Amphidinium_carterae.1
MDTEWGTPMSIAGTFSCFTFSYWTKGVSIWDSLRADSLQAAKAGTISSEEELAYLNEKGWKVMTVTAAPGCGKTALLESFTARMRKSGRQAFLVTFNSPRAFPFEEILQQ